MPRHPDRLLGPDGPFVFPLGIGTMSFTPFYGPVTEDEAFAILDAAMDHGVNHLDSANIYGSGLAETIIGRYIARNGASAREFFSIATKAGFDRENGNSVIRNDAAHLTEQLDGSLQRLGVEQVDLFYIHRRDPAIPIEDVAGTLKGFVEAGKIRGFGFSEIAPSSLHKAQAVHPVAAIQSEYSLSSRNPDLGMVQATKALGATMVAFSPVGRSLLTDRPISGDRVNDLPFLSVNPRFSPDNLPANIAAAAGFRALADDMGMPSARLAIAWLLHQGDHVLPIPGTRSLDHFMEMVPAAEVMLGADDLAAIDQVLPPGWAYGDRYSEKQWNAVERYC